MITVAAIKKILGERSLSISCAAADEMAIEKLLPMSELSDVSALFFYKGSDRQVLDSIANFTNALVFVNEKFKDEIAESDSLAFTPNPQLAFLYVSQSLLPKENHGISDKAIIHPKAEIAENVSVYPGAIVGKAKIGRGTVIREAAVICDHVEIGADCFISQSAIIGSWAPGSIIDERGKNIVFPQIGKLIIGSEVFIGTSSVVHIGALSNTLVEDNCHIAGNCLIGHNCILRSNSYLAPNVTLAGGVDVGEDTYIGIRSVVKENIRIANQVTIGMNCQIDKDLTKAGRTIMNSHKNLELGEMFSLNRKG